MTYIRKEGGREEKEGRVNEGSVSGRSSGAAGQRCVVVGGGGGGDDVSSHGELASGALQLSPRDGGRGQRQRRPGLRLGRLGACRDGG